MWVHLPHVPFAQLACEQNLRPGTLGLGSDGGLHARRWNLHVPPNLANMFIRSYKLLLALEEHFPEDFKVSVADEFLRIDVDGISTGARTLGDVDVLHEILVLEQYRFQSAVPIVVVDVGMNVGVASLAFARHPAVKAVHGFELFRPTWEQAQQNFQLNPELAGKITSQAIGLGDSSQEMVLPFADEIKGVVGLDGPMHPHPELMLRKEHVIVRSAAEVLREIRSLHKGMPLLLKMDCEGGEGRILENLAQNGLLEEVAMVVMEWHGAEMLAKVERLLVAHGFSTTAQRFRTGDVGSLSAYRSRAAY